MRIRIHTRLLLVTSAILLASFLSSPSQLARAQALSDPMPVDPQITIGKFANGMRYYIRANKKPEERMELRLVVKAGSILEDDDQQGLAHLVEHMAFNGTKNFPKNEVVTFLESLGMRFGADVNAYTSFDETVYILTVPTDKPEMMDRALQILEDWAHNLSSNRPRSKKSAEW
jgi:zinc protease